MANIREYRNKDGKLVSYYIKVYRGRDVEGKQLTPYTATFKVDSDWSERRARKEVEKYAIKFEEECKNGVIVKNSITIGEYIDYIIELKNSRNQLKKRTYYLYKGIANKIKDEIGYIKLKDIKVVDLNNYYSSLDNLSSKSIHEYHGIIRMALNQAVKEGLLVYNIADRVELPKLNKPEVKYFQKEDIIRIIEAAELESLEHRILIYLFIFTGARRGEIAGLKWESIDFDNKQIHICNNVLYTSEVGIYEDTPKTVNSDRYIVLPDEVMNMIREYKNVAKNEKYVFSDRMNVGPIHPDSISTYLKRFSKKYDLPHINSHAFRHSMASILYHEGMDVVSISARLGHSRVSTTANIYTHKMNKYDEKNAKILKNLYFVEK